MNEDQFLYACTIACPILIYFTLRYSKAFAIGNLFLYVAYSAFMYYGLFYRSQYGASLVWFLYLLAITILHILVLVVYLIVKAAGKRKSN